MTGVFQAYAMDPLKIAIAGASGRMGRLLIEAVRDHPHMQLVGALHRPGGTLSGQDAGAFCGCRTGVMVTDDMDEALRHAQCLIDFTHASAAMAHLEAVLRHGVKLVLGTTGLSAEQHAALKMASQHLAMVVAPNTSVGVNVTFKLLALAARLLSADYDTEIIEMHHRNKVDAPSGTAIRMGEIIAAARGLNLPEVAVYGRQGHTGSRDASTIGFATIRGGDIVGEHTALFAGAGERIEITHKSASRVNYAKGALRAAHFLADKTCGLFDMQDVLGLSGTGW